MDTYLAIASKRDWRNFADRPIPEDVATRILDAGRLAGSASNKQHWRFVVVESDDLKQQVAEGVYAGTNITGAALVVAIVAPEGDLPTFDSGRASQNMMLAGWNEGVASVPNGMPDAARMGEVLGAGDGERVVIVLSFGYPSREQNPESSSAEEWSARAERKSLGELVTRR